MGLFVLPNLEEETVENCVETALANIELWKKNKDCDYLLDTFACQNLKSAARLIRIADQRPSAQDLKKQKEADELRKLGG